MIPKNPYGDAAVYADMETILMRHIQSALIECSAISRDLTCHDPVEVMASLNEHFTKDALDDNFTQALFGFRENLCELGLSYYDAHDKPRPKKLSASSILIPIINLNAAAE